MSSPVGEYALLPAASCQDLEDPPPYMAEDRRGWIEAPSRNGKRTSRAVFFGTIALFIAALVLTVRHVLKPRLVGLSISTAHESPFSSLWPVGLPNTTDKWENENSKSLHALVTCMASNSCGENQKSIVLLSSDRFANAIRGAVAGEEIWAISVRHALQQMGYTALFTKTNEQMEATYREFPDLVKVIFLEGKDAEKCFRDGSCVKTKDHPLGVPAWKMLSFYFWTGSANPLGNAWTMSPENYPLISPSDSAENVYMGYSIEEPCSQTPYIPFDERPRQAYLFGKKLEYFGFGYTWPQIVFDEPPFDVSFVASIREGGKNNETLPQGITDFGFLDKTGFYRHVAESRILIGIGNPRISPSPYDALCMGVPFLNPIKDFDREHPDDRTKWKTQHEALKYQDPPYVYNVLRTDEKAFWDAVQKAMETPIDRYILPNMTMEALKVRVRDIVETDWKGKAERLLEERIRSRKGDLFEI